MNEQIKIDAEFKRIIPPLSDEEFSQLKENILKDGCIDPIVLWDDTIIDGHNRFKICSENNVPFKTVQMEFHNRDEAINWIIRNQFGRRNISLYERARLALRLKPLIAEKAKEKKIESGGAVPQKSAKPPIDTRNELAKIAGVSHDTIAKVEKIEAKASSEIKDNLMTGKSSINQAYKAVKEVEQREKALDKPYEWNDILVEESEEEFDEPEFLYSVTEEIQKSDVPEIPTVPVEVKIIEEKKEPEHRPHVINNSGNNEWYTPSFIIEAARKSMNGIDLDPASCEMANATVKAEKYYTVEENGLEQNWFGNVWLNPPYSSELIGKFVDKTVSERHNYSQAIVLVNNSTETGWFIKLVSIASAICFPQRRVKYYTPVQGVPGSPLQGQAIVYIGDNIDTFSKEFESIGWIAKELYDKCE